MIKPLEIVIKAITKPFVDAMAAASASAKKMGADTQKAGDDASQGLKRAGDSAKSTSSGFNAFGGVVKSTISSMLTQIAILSAAIAGVVITVKKVTEAWMEQETTTTRLNSAIKRSGQNLNEAAVAFDDYTAKMQAMGVAEDVIQNNLIKLTKAGFDYEKAVKLNNAAMALGYRQYGDFAAGTNAVEMAMVGATKGIKRLGVEVDAGASKAQIYEAIIKKAGDTTATFGDYSNTTAGKIGALKEVSAEATEAIGKGLVGGLINATSTGGNFNKNIENTMNWLNKVAEVIAVWVIPGIKAFISTIVGFERTVATPVINALMAIAAGFTAIGQAAARDLQGAQASWQIMKELVKGIPSDMKQGWAETKKAANGYFDDAEKRLKQFNKLGRSTEGGREAPPNLGAGGDAKKATASDYLSSERLRIENEILDKKLEGNDALEYEKSQLVVILEHLKKTKDSFREQVEVKRRIHDIDQDFEKQREEASKRAADQREREQKEALDMAKEFAEDVAREDEKAAREAAEWAEKKRRIEEKARAEQSEYREKEARAGGTRGTLTQIFTGLFPGIAAKEAQKEWAADIEKQIALEKQLAYATGAAYDETGQRIQAVIARIQELQAEGKDTTALMKDLQTLGRQRAAEERVAEGKKAAAEQAKAIEEAQKRANEAQYEDTKNMYKSAIRVGMEEGAAAGAKSLADAVKEKMMDAVAESIANAMMGGGGVGGGSISMMFGGGGGGKGGGFLGMLGGLFGGGGGGKSTAPSAFAQGWAGMKPEANVMGAATKGGGFPGMLGGAMGFLGPALAMGSMFGLFGGKKKQEMSGVQPIFGGPSVRGTDWGALYGGDIFQSASFSARNQGNALLKERAAARMGAQEVKVTVDSSKDFHVKIEKKMTGVMNFQEVKGTPSRTGFTHF